MLSFRDATELPTSGNLRLEVLGPDGETLAAVQQQVQLPLQVGRITGIPVRAQLVAQLPIPVSKSGDYTVRVALDFKEIPGSLSDEVQIPIWDQEKQTAARINA